MDLQIHHRTFNELTTTTTLGRIFFREKPTRAFTLGRLKRNRRSGHRKHVESADAAKSR
jgi:hypothetical protein